MFGGKLERLLAGREAIFARNEDLERDEDSEASAESAAADVAGSEHKDESATAANDESTAALDGLFFIDTSKSKATVEQKKRAVTKEKAKSKRKTKQKSKPKKRKVSDTK